MKFFSGLQRIWNTGILEYWNKNIPFSHHSIIPIFHHSNIPVGCLLLTLFFNTEINAQLHLGPFVGSVTEKSAVFIVKTYGEQPVMIELFSESDIDNSIFTSEVTAYDSNYNYTKIFYDGFQPEKTYYYRAVVNGIPSKRWHTFKTFPAQNRINFSFGFGSCQQAFWRETTPEIFPLIGQDSLRFFIQLGDWTYPDTTEKYGYFYNEKFNLLAENYNSKYDYNFPFANEVLSQMPIVYMYDDHDYAGNNTDGANPGKNNSINAYKKFFPHYPLANPENGIWQSFKFGDVEFFLPDLRSQRSPNENTFDDEGNFSPPPGHSILAGFPVDGENQKEWLIKALKNSTAEWKVILSSVMFNPAYIKALDIAGEEKLKWLKKDVPDKWAGFPEDFNALINTIISNNIKNVLVLTGDSHSAYIDDGKNSVLPEMAASILDVENFNVPGKLEKAGLDIFNSGFYEGDNFAYGKVSFFYGKEDYVLLEIIDDTGKIILSHKIIAE